jgi:hypothetical protein
MAAAKGIRMAPDDVQRGWWKTFSDTLHDGYFDLIGAEEDASRVVHFHHTFVPGLLQTEDYARAITKATTLKAISAGEVDVLVRVKKLRQRSAFQSDRPKELVFLVDEAALYRPIGGPHTMQTQLRHLLTVADNPSVKLVVLTFLKPHPGHQGPFMVLQYGGGLGDVLCFEWQMGNTVVRDQPKLAHLYKALADELASTDPDGRRAKDAIQEALLRS